MPGSFMSEKINNINPGKGYLRIALGHDNKTENMLRLSDYFKNFEDESKS